MKNASGLDECKIVLISYAERKYQKGSNRFYVSTHLTLYLKNMLTIRC